MGSTYLHVRISGFLDFQELQKVDKTGPPRPLFIIIITPSLFPTAVMDVQILGDEDSGPSITTS